MVPPFDPWRHLQLLRNIDSGAGFTLFNDQSYFWYNPLWYLIAAPLNPLISPEVLSAGFSVAASGLFFFFLLRTEGSVVVAVTGALLVTAFGPYIAFTAGYGAESFAMALMFGALLCCTYETKPTLIVFGGLFFGIALINRMNLAFNILLFLPLLKNRRNLVVFVSGFSLPLLLTGWRNHQIISSYDYLFSWDGLATASKEYGLLSTLLPQINRASAEATRALYEVIVPVPQWLSDGGKTNWGIILFMLLAVICLIASRRPWLIATGLGSLLYFNFFDRTLSTYFFRHYLAIFPVLFIGIAIVTDRIWRAEGWTRRLSRFLSVTIVLAVLLCGGRYLTPIEAVPIEMSLPPADLLTEHFYMVNSGFYHPEALVYRFEHKRFIGLPLYPEQFDGFAEVYGKNATILWHIDFSVQDKLLKYLINTGRYAVSQTATNRYGIRYLLLQPTDQPSATRSGNE